MQPDALRRLALSLPEAHEAPHFERTSFRVGKKIFATMTADGAEAMVKLASPDDVEGLLSSKPAVFFSYGTWTTRNGALGVRLAKVSPGDVVFDLGCGDGRIVIAAVRQFKARGVCVDIDPQRIAESRENARQAGVTDRILFLNQDLFATDDGDATAVMLFLSPDFNRALRPKLLRELKPGTRIVSHWHDMGDWKPQETVRIESGGYERVVYLWIVPKR